MVGAFSDGTCAVSPRGRVRCVARYQPAGTTADGVSTSIVLQGALGTIVTGATSYAAHPPAFFRIGRWSATR